MITIAGTTATHPVLTYVDIATIGNSISEPVRLKTAIFAIFIKEMVDIGMGRVMSHSVSFSVAPAFLDLNENSMAKKNTKKQKCIIRENFSCSSWGSIDILWTIS